MSKFFAFINRMKFIKRWALMRSVREENIMEHSQQVAVISHALAVIHNKLGGNANIEKTVLTAQYHEVSEVITGDLPTPIKYYNAEMKSAYKDLEKKACKRILDMLPEDFRGDFEQYIIPDTSSIEYKLVKYADRLSAYLKCVEEINAGNKEFIKAKASIEKDLKSYNSPEVEYYLKEFVPAYELTLDEID